MKRKELQDAVEVKAQQAAERGAQAYSTARAKLSPYIAQANDFVGPYVEQAGDAIAPYVAQAGEAIAPYVAQANERITPYVEKAAPIAQEAVSKGASATAQALESLHPHVDDALAKIAPAVEDARAMVSTTIMPKVTEALYEVADRSAHQAAIAAGSTEVEVPKKKGSKAKKFLVITAISAGIVGAVAVFRKLTASKSGWVAHAPSSYTPPTFNTSTAADDMAAEGGPALEETESELPPTVDAPPDAPVEEAAADTEQVADLEADLGVGSDQADAAEAATEAPSDAGTPASGDAPADETDDADSAGGGEPFRS